MRDLKDKKHFNKDAILMDLIRIIENMAGDWEMGFAGEIGPGTYLVEDLAFKSIKMAQMASSIGEHFKNNDLPFQELIMPDGPDGRVVNDLLVSEIADFLYTHLNKP